MKSVSRAAQGRAGQPAVGVPVSSATGGKAGPMRVAACALAITAAIAASPAHAQYYSVDDGGTPSGNSTNNGATGVGSLAAGTDATSTGLAATAVGSKAQASGDYTIAIGEQALATGENSVSIGRGAGILSHASRDNVAVGTMAGNTMQGEGNAAVGTGAGAIVQGSSNTAMGNVSGVSVTGSYNSAFGSSAGIAVYGDSNTAIGTSAGIGVGRIGAPVLNNAAFGALAGNGVLTSTNVAIGYVSGNAVSGGDNNVSIGTYSGTAVAGGNNVNIGSRAGMSATGNSNIAIGMDAGSFIGSSAAPVNDAIAFGNAARATQSTGVALGYQSSATTVGGVALGAGSVADRAAGAYVDPVSGNGFTTTAGAVSVGAAGAARQVINVAPGVQITDAVNLGQLQSAVSTLNQTINGLPPGGGGRTWATGNPTTYTAPSASGRNATATGSGAVASGDASTAIGDHAYASGVNSVAVGANSVASAPNTLSVGSVGNERGISNVAPGVNGTDAVNLSQLNNAAAQSNRYTDQQIKGLKRYVDGGVAATMAVAGLPQATEPGKNMVSMAGSTWQGQQGMAIGISRVSERGRWIYKGSLATSTRGHGGAVIGAGYQW